MLVQLVSQTQKEAVRRVAHLIPIGITTSPVRAKTHVINVRGRLAYIRTGVWAGCDSRAPDDKARASSEEAAAGASHSAVQYG